MKIPDNKERIIVNAANLRKGGGVQVGISLIRNFMNREDIAFKFVVSEEIFADIESHHDVILFESRSKFNLLRMLELRAFLKSLEIKFNPQKALTIFGPSFWRPKCFHLVGYAIPHYIYMDSSPFLLRYSFQQKIVLYTKKIFDLHYFKNNSDALFTETIDASDRLGNLLNKPVVTINNSLNDYLVTGVSKPNFPLYEIKILCVSSYYPHKNLEILREVKEILDTKGLNVQFHFTLDNKYWYKFECKGFVNHGLVKVSELSSLYKACHALVLPTLLECFSATYLEASKFGLPILTSDLPFARTVCGENALYFDPLNAMDIANKIEGLFVNEKSFLKAQSSALKIWNRYPSATERASAIIKYLLKPHQ